MAKTFDIDQLIDSVFRGKTPTEFEMKTLCEKAKEIFAKEPNNLKLHTPITVCGDVHGQFDDVKELFEVGGHCPGVNYLFLGDIVDRGRNSVETLAYLMALKVKYPERVYVIRGNHETK